MKFEERIIEALKEPICDNCLGRSFGMLLSGMTNEDRGNVFRRYVAFLLDSGEKIDVDNSNFHGIKFKNAKISSGSPKKCSVCQNFFLEKIDDAAKKAAEKLRGVEYSTFVIGSIPSDEMKIAEEKLWNRVGIDYVEMMKAEVNREVGKRLEKITKKKFELDDPDAVILIDMNRNEVRVRMKSLYIAGGYKKLVRGIPQTRWICMECMGKGCVECKGEGKRYKTSVQEIIGEPSVKAADGDDHAFHGSGREDIDARCLDYRPFVIEVVKPHKRKIDLKKLEKAINKSPKVKVRGLKFSDKENVRKIKADRHDKTYEAEVDFEKDVDKKLLPKVRSLKGAVIAQQTPTRVKHRRADIMRKRGVKSISYKVLGKRKVKFVIRGEAGLYIKELISGDEGRTEPNIAGIIGNKVRRIYLDVKKVWPVS